MKRNKALFQTDLFMHILYINHKRTTKSPHIHPLLNTLSNYNIATVEGGEIPDSYLQIPSP